MIIVKNQNLVVGAIVVDVLNNLFCKPILQKSLQEVGIFLLTKHKYLFGCF